MVCHSRRDFLRGNLAPDETDLIRPPGSRGDFPSLCDRCGKCTEACPEGIILQGRGRLPLLDLSKGACTFCGDCARACPTGALLAEHVADWPWRAEIGPACLSLRGIACRACEDACEPRAIRFRLMTAGRAVPELDPDRCTGCGACAFTCPAGAVRFRRDPPAAEGARE